MNKRPRAYDKNVENTEGNKFRGYFVRVFEKYDIRNQERFGAFCKWLIFLMLISMEILMLLQCLGEYVWHGEWKSAMLVVITESVLTLCEGLRLFVVKKRSVGNSILYVLNALAIVSFMLLAENSIFLIVYMLFLTEFYIDASKPKFSIYWICFSIPFYVLVYMIRLFLLNNTMLPLSQVIAQSVGGILALMLHFLIVHVGLAFYRQFLRLNKALAELDESKKELEKAYAAAAEVATLEERQRIAKDVHDTAGHSLTTVIMQTEAAKRILENDPEEAKQKIIAANLQAKHALEELRESVHLLSGREEMPTLKQVLLDIVHDSTDGTGIIIRSAIEEVETSEAKQRFLCNTLKEGISNGLRHGGATAFWFELKIENEEIVFVLSDNGKGADMSALQEGFGLTTMRERASSLGGKLRLSADLEEGFEICLILPMDKKDGTGYGTEN